MVNMKKFTCYLILTLLFFLTNYFNSIFGICCLVYVFYLIIRGNKFDNIYLIFFLLPNIRILDALGIKFSINMLILFSAIRIIMFDCLKNRKFLIQKRWLFAFIFVIFMELMHVLLNDISIFSILFNAINIAFDFVLCIMLIEEDYREYDYHNISRHLLCGCFVSSLVYILCNSSTINMIFMSNYRLSAYGNDPNYLSTYIVLGIAGLLLSNIKSKSNFIDLFLILINVFIGLLTSSKMCMLLLVLLFLLYLLFNFFHFHIKKISAICIKVIPMICILILMFNDQIMYLVNKVILRFGNLNDSNISYLTTGRNTIMNFYWTHMNESVISILFGRGINYLTYYSQFGINLVAHNTIFDFILSWGLIGSLCFTIVFLYNILPSLSLKKKSFINYLPLLLYLIMQMSLSCMSADMFWYLLAFTIIPLKNSNKNVKKEVNI